MDDSKVVEYVNLKTIRELKNLSQTYVAYKLGISQSYYSKLENHVMPINLSLLMGFCALLKIEITELIQLSLTGTDPYTAIVKRNEELNGLLERISCIEKRILELEERIEHANQSI